MEKKPPTKMGGLISEDCTQGYGPEEFMLKKALPGVYKVEVDYYGHSRQTITGKVALMVSIFSKFGTHEQQEKQVVLRLKDIQDRTAVAEFIVEK